VAASELTQYNAAMQQCAFKVLDSGCDLFVAVVVLGHLGSICATLRL